MIYSLVLSLSFLAIPVAACEGQCIVDVTQAFVGNYTTPTQNVFEDAAAQISKLVLASRSSTEVLKLMEPLRNAYQSGAYDAMEKAIFPSYFHGKCQVNGVDPEGCPNPDCPVVCGTPGSLVHFYNILQEIAYNTTAANLAALCAPSNSAFKTFETSVLDELYGKTRSRRSLHSARIAPRLAPHSYRLADTTPPLNGRSRKREIVSKNEAKLRVMSACKSMANDLANQCGGKSTLSKCSWEQEMKAFILSFP